MPDTARTCQSHSLGGSGLNEFAIQVTSIVWWWLRCTPAIVAISVTGRHHNQWPIMLSAIQLSYDSVSLYLIHFGFMVLVTCLAFVVSGELAFGVHQLSAQSLQCVNKQQC